MELQLLKQEFVYKGPVFDVSHDTVQLPSGLVIEVDIINHNGGSAVLPLFKNNDVLLVEQYRHAARESLIEIPAGRLEVGEDPQNTALRELEEETGWKANKIEILTQFYALPGYSSEILYCFLGTELVPGETCYDQDEEIQVHRLSFVEALQLVKSGKIKDAKTIMSLILTAQKLNILFN